MLTYNGKALKVGSNNVWLKMSAIPEYCLEFVKDTAWSRTPITLSIKGLRYNGTTVPEISSFLSSTSYAGVWKSQTGDPTSDTYATKSLKGSATGGGFRAFFNANSLATASFTFDFATRNYNYGNVTFIANLYLSENGTPVGNPIATSTFVQTKSDETITITL